MTAPLEPSLPSLPSISSPPSVPHVPGGRTEPRRAHRAARRRPCTIAWRRGLTLGGLLGLLAAGSGLLGLVPQAAAQAGARPAALPSVPPPGPPDTMIVPGRQDLARYTTPTLCLRAVQAVEAHAHFTDEDTAAVDDHTRDTLATATVALARRCGARFTVATTAPADQLDLMRLALYMRDDTLARAAGERYVAAVTEPEAHRWALYALETEYLLGAKPIRLAAAEAIAARLDSLGAVAAVQRAKVHSWLLLHARLRYDLAAMEREAVAAVAADNDLTAEDRQLWDGGEGAGGGAASVIFMLELYRNPKAALARTEQRLKALGYTQWHADQPLPFGLDRGIAQIGKPAPPLTADVWVGGDSAAHRWPVPGRVSVLLGSLLNVPDDAADTPEQQLWMKEEAARMAVWRRMLTKYGAALSVTVLVKARGSFRGGPPLSPPDEAAQVGKFYREELGVPVTVAVQTTPVKQLPDGRRLRGPAPFERDPYYSERFLLTDRAGVVALALPRMGLEEAVLNAWLARAVGR